MNIEVVKHGCWRSSLNFCQKTLLLEAFIWLQETHYTIDTRKGLHIWRYGDEERERERRGRDIHSFEKIFLVGQR